MAKVSIKSEKLTPFGGIYFTEDSTPKCNYARIASYKHFNAYFPGVVSANGIIMYVENREATHP